MSIVKIRKFAAPDAPVSLYETGGLLSAYDLLDSEGDIVMKGAFDHIPDGARVPVFYNHEYSTVPVGVAVLSKSLPGLRCAITLTKGVQLAEELALALQARTIEALSMGAWIDARDIRHTKKGRELHKVNIAEATLTPWGANPEALLDKSATRAAATADHELFARLVKLFGA